MLSPFLAGGAQVVRGDPISAPLTPQKIAPSGLVTPVPLPLFVLYINVTIRTHIFRWDYKHLYARARGKHAYPGCGKVGVKDG